MANAEHLAMLKQGVEVWNQWRKTNPDFRPDLSQFKFSQETLIGINLSMAFLGEADLHGASLPRAILSGADLQKANLNGVNFFEANFRGATLHDADLRGANLFGADLSGAHLRGANFEYAYMGGTVFGNNDLNAVYGLDKVIHQVYSFLDLISIYRCQGQIPEVFLRGVGAPDSFIEYMRSLVGKPIDFYSAFISYSSKDEEFAQRLYNDLQGAGVRCWFAPEDLKIGAKIRPSIDESIRLHDKLLLVLSRTSVTSQWVEQEVETALARERKEGKVVLFPVRLDQAVMKQDTGWPSLIRNTRNIGDFTRWKDHDAYQTVFARLLRDLKVDAVLPLEPGS